VTTQIEPWQPKPGAQSVGPLQLVRQPNAPQLYGEQLIVFGVPQLPTPLQVAGL
jgi:hypothetical protein